MTKEEYENFVLRYKGCGACFPMYHTLSRFEKMWFTAIQKDVVELEKQIEKMKWHYLVKDPKDLPKKEGSYWVCIRDGKYKEDGSWEWTSKPLCMTGIWLDGAFCKAGGSPVIAWCELPKWEIKQND